MLRLFPAAAVVTFFIVRAVPAVAGGGWTIDHGDNAPNVQVKMTPVAEDRAAAGAGCDCTIGMTSGAQYVPGTSGASIVFHIPGYGRRNGPFFMPYGAAGYDPHGLGGGASPQVVFWANPGQITN